MNPLNFHFLQDDSFAVNLDIAMIDRLIVVGTKWADSFCDLCTPGYYRHAPFFKNSFLLFICRYFTILNVFLLVIEIYFSQAGEMLCTKCPADTHSNIPGATQCTNCPEDQYAVLGSAECFNRSTCTSNDYYSYYTPCSSV